MVSTGLLVKVAAMIPAVAGFLHKTVVAAVLTDEFAKNPVEHDEVLEIRPEIPVFSNLIRALGRQPLVLFVQPQGRNNCADTSAANGLRRPLHFGITPV